MPTGGVEAEDDPPPALPDELATLSYWSLPAVEALARAGSTTDGLPAAEAARRLERAGPNRVAPRQRWPAWASVLARQFRNPLVLVLLVAMAVSGLTGDVADVSLVAVIVLLSTALSFFQEYDASRAIAALQERLRTRCTVRRDGLEALVDVEAVVPGDLVLLKAGSLVPADALVLEARDCDAVEASLTGESLPVRKQPGVLPRDTPPAARSNVLYMGSSLRSGTATALVMATGGRTSFGHIARQLEHQRPLSDFERGMRRFSALLTEFVLALTLVLTAVNLLLERPPAESVLFAVALAVGMTPELLPAIMTYTLARSARALARRDVLVRRLTSIENLGSITVLCTDKTGTLTEGRMALQAAIDATGQPSPLVSGLAVINASLQSGYANALDDALLAACPPMEQGRYAKQDEQPFDFATRRLSVLALDGRTGRYLTLCKGSPAGVLEICDQVRLPGGESALTPALRASAEALARDRAGQGLRVLAFASHESPDNGLARDGLTFEGLLLFVDPLQQDVGETLAALGKAGVRVVLVTGDAAPTAVWVAGAAGLSVPAVITGGELRGLSDAALVRSVSGVGVFAEVNPDQKHRIIAALRRGGEVVGYIGDGINDAPALHAADIGIAAANAADVARQAADIVFLRPGLSVIRDAILEGRSTFHNTQKYLLATTSANLGNMLSMAVASVYLPFLPLTAAQILVNNVLSDLPALTLPSDRVDAVMLQAPARWDVRHIRRFTLAFGVLSTLFDILTFVVLWNVGDRLAPEFRAGWFLESLLTEILVLFVLRTPLPMLRARPGLTLVLVSAAVAAVALLLVATPLGVPLGLATLPWGTQAAMIGITLAYVIATEALKQRLMRRYLARAG